MDYMTIDLNCYRSVNITEVYIVMPDMYLSGDVASKLALSSNGACFMRLE